MKECPNCLFEFREGKTVCPACHYITDVTKTTASEFENEYQYNKFTKLYNDKNKVSIEFIIFAVVSILWAIAIMIFPNYVEPTKQESLYLQLSLPPMIILSVLLLTSMIKLIKEENEKLSKQSSEIEGTLVAYRWGKIHKRNLLNYFIKSYNVYPIVEYTVNNKTYRARSINPLKGYENKNGKRNIVGEFNEEEHFKVFFEEMDPANARVQLSRKHTKNYVLTITNDLIFRFIAFVISLIIIVSICVMLYL